MCIICILSFVPSPPAPPARKNPKEYSMCRSKWLVILSNLLMFSAAGLSAQTEKRDAYLQEEVIPFFENYCVSCHNADDAMAGIRVDHVGADRTFLVNRKNWLKVSAVLRFGAMPPESADQPHADLRGDIYHWLSEELDTIDCNIAKDPGRVTIRRLNRLEYDNTIRDLFGVDFRLAEDFPSDGCFTILKANIVWMAAAIMVTAIRA